MITVEEARGTKTNLEVVEGMQFDRGYLSPYFVTKPERLAKLVGGVALLRCVAALDEMKLSGDQAVGVSIVKRALEEPIRQIVINAGVEGAVIVMEVKKNKKAAYRCG